MAKRKTTEVAQRAKAKAVADLLEGEGYHRQSAESAAMSEIRRRFRNAMNSPDTGGKIDELDTKELADAVKEKHAARLGKPAESAKKVRSAPKGAKETSLEETLAKSIEKTRSAKAQNAPEGKPVPVESPKSLSGTSEQAIKGLAATRGPSVSSISAPAQGAEMLQELTAAVPDAVQNVKTSQIELARPVPVRTPAPFPEAPLPDATFSSGLPIAEPPPAVPQAGLPPSPPPELDPAARIRGVDLPQYPEGPVAAQSEGPPPPRLRLNPLSAPPSEVPPAWQAAGVAPEPAVAPPAPPLQHPGFADTQIRPPVVEAPPARPSIGRGLLGLGTLGAVQFALPGVESLTRGGGFTDPYRQAVLERPIETGVTTVLSMIPGLPAQQLGGAAQSIADFFSPPTQEPGWSLRTPEPPLIEPGAGAPASTPPMTSADAIAEALARGGQEVTKALSSPIDVTGAEPSVDQLLAAISQIESGGDYNIVRRTEKTPRGTWGRYQLLYRNIAPWTAEHLEKKMSPEDFLASPEAQDQVARGEIAKYIRQAHERGLEGPAVGEYVASAWHLGPGSGPEDTQHDHQLYMRNFRRAMGSVPRTVGGALKQLGKTAVSGGLADVVREAGKARIPVPVKSEVRPYQAPPEREEIAYSPDFLRIIGESKNPALIAEWTKPVPKDEDTSGFGITYRTPPTQGVPGPAPDAPAPNFVPRGEASRFAGEQIAQGMRRLAAQPPQAPVPFDELREGEAPGSNFVPTTPNRFQMTPSPTTVGLPGLAPTPPRRVVPLDYLTDYPPKV